MSKTVNFCFKIDFDIREEAIAICEKEGTSLAEVLRSLTTSITEGKQKLVVPPPPPERRITLKDSE